MNTKDTTLTDGIAAARDISVVLALAGVAVAFALTEHAELAATALGGCLSYVVPWHRARVPASVGAVALGIVAALAVGGCSGATPASIRREACNAATTICRAVDATCGSEAAP